MKLKFLGKIPPLNNGTNGIEMVRPVHLPISVTPRLTQEVSFPYHLSHRSLNKVLNIQKKYFSSDFKWKKIKKFSFTTIEKCVIYLLIKFKNKTEKKINFIANVYKILIETIRFTNYLK